MADTHPDFSGTWKFIKSENFEEFLAANGANWFIRKMACNVSPTVNIEHEGDSFYIKTVMPFRTQEDRLTVGQAYTQVAMSGAKMRVTPWWDEDVLILDSEPEETGKGKPYSVMRELKDEQLVMTMKIDDVVCTRWFNKV